MPYKHRSSKKHARHILPEQSYFLHMGAEVMMYFPWNSSLAWRCGRGRTDTVSHEWASASRLLWERGGLSSERIWESGVGLMPSGLFPHREGKTDITPPTKVALKINVVDTSEPPISLCLRQGCNKYIALGHIMSTVPTYSRHSSFFMSTGGSDYATWNHINTNELK